MLFNPQILTIVLSVVLYSQRPLSDNRSAAVQLCLNRVTSVHLYSIHPLSVNVTEISELTGTVVTNCFRFQSIPFEAQLQLGR